MRKTKWSRMMKLMNGLLLAACLFTGSILTSQTIEAGQTSARAGSKIIYVNDNSGETGLAMYVPKGMTVSNKSSAESGELFVPQYGRLFFFLPVGKGG